MLNNNLDLEVFGVSAGDIVQLDERTLLITKWDWPYDDAHAFQRHCLSLLEEQPRLRILIACNHPRVLTHGRGLQRAKKGESLNLIDFDPSRAHNLPFPLYQIERGGGLTFHHPGQFIFYPIVKLNPTKLSLSKMIDDIFASAEAVLNDWGLSGLTHENKLLGLWLGPKKVASMGIAIEKLTTFHGMALNLYRDDVMMNVMRSLNPCGLEASTYVAIEDVLELNGKSVDDFRNEFVKRIMHAWK